MKNLIDWLNEGYEIFKKRMAAAGENIEGEFPYQNTTAIVCKDGFSVSIQASGSHYSTPRRYFDRLENDRDFSRVIVDYGIYTAFELGFPSEADDLITEYAENDEDLTDTVYGWVPLATVEALIEKHGGIVGFKEMLN